MTWHAASRAATRRRVVPMVMEQPADANERVGSVHSMHSTGTMADNTIATAAEHQLRRALVADGVLNVQNAHCGQDVRTPGPSAGPGAEVGRGRRAVRRSRYVSDGIAIVSKRYHHLPRLIEYHRYFR